MRMRIATIAVVASMIAMLAGCAPEPVPWAAKPKWTLKNGVTWHWQQQVASGCVDWMAQESWVSTYVMVDTPCEERGSIGYRNAKGARYSSTFDEVTFHGFFEWNSKIFGEQIVFDDQGMWAETKPCPYQLTESQISGMVKVVREAQELEGTRQEHAVLARLEERLASSDGTGLASAQFGCEHEPDDTSWQDVTKRPDPWRDEI